MKQIRFITTTLLFCAFISFCFGQKNNGPILSGENIAVTSTKYGKVRGYIDDGIFAYKGIPYARAERFMPPQSPDKWEGMMGTEYIIDPENDLIALFYINMYKRDQLYHNYLEEVYDVLDTPKTN